MREWLTKGSSAEIGGRKLSLKSLSPLPLLLLVALLFVPGSLAVSTEQVDLGWNTKRIVYRRPDLWRNSDFDVFIEYQDGDALSDMPIPETPSLWMPMRRCDVAGYFAVEIAVTRSIGAAGRKTRFHFVDGQTMLVDYQDCKRKMDFELLSGESDVLVDGERGLCRAERGPCCDSFDAASLCFKAPRIGKRDSGASTTITTTLDSPQTTMDDNQTVTTTVPAITADAQTTTATAATTTIEGQFTMDQNQTTSDNPLTTTDVETTTTTTDAETTTTTSAMPTTTTDTPTTTTTSNAPTVTTTITTTTTTGAPTTTTSEVQTTTEANPTTTTVPITTTEISTTTTDETSPTTTSTDQAAQPTTTTTTTAPPQITITTSAPLTTTTAAFQPLSVFDVSRAIFGNSQLALRLGDFATAGTQPITTVSLHSFPAHGSVAPFNESMANPSLDVSSGLFVEGETTFDSLTYSPAAYFSGQDGFVLKVCDHSTCLESLVTVTLQSPSSLHPVVIDHKLPLANKTSTSAVAVVILSGPEVAALNLTACELVRAPASGSVTLLVEGTNLVAIYTPAGKGFNDSFSYSLCDNWGSCAVTSVSITYSDEQPSFVPGSVCLGGIEIFVLGGLLGIESLDSTAASRFWFLVDYMQFLAATDVYGLSIPQRYSDFTACFSWLNFDVSLSLNGSETRPASFPEVGQSSQKTRQGRQKRDYQEYALAIDIPESVVLLYKLFFFCVIFFPPLILGCVLSCVGILIRPNQFTDFQNVVDGNPDSRRRRDILLKLEWWCFGLAYRIAYFAYYSFTFGMAAQLARTVATKNTQPLFSLSTVVAVLSLVGGSVGMPLFTFIWTRRHKKRQEHFTERTPFTETEKENFEKISRLEQSRLLAPYYLHYKEERSHFGLLLFAKKFLLGVFLGSLQFSAGVGFTSVIIGIGVIALYLVAMVALRPHKKWRYYLFEGMFNVAQIVILVLLAILPEATSSSTVVLAMEALHYAVMTCFLVLCIPFLIYDLYIWRTSKRRSKVEQYELGSRLASRKNREAETE